MPICALEEKQKFLKFMGEAEWSMEMDALKQKLLGCAKLDEKPHQDQGNYQNVLPTLLQVFQRQYPAKAVKRLEGH